MITLAILKRSLRQFLEERDWLDFNSFSSLSKTIFIESTELLECYLKDFDLEEAREEIGDIYSALLQIDMLKEKYAVPMLEEADIEAMWEESAAEDSFKTAKKITVIASSLLNEENPSSFFAKADSIYPYLYSYCKATGSDPASCLLHKLELTALHYPVEKCKGKATKYDKL